MGTNADLTGGDPGYPPPVTVPEFARRLRLLRVWAGNPSFERLSRLSGVPRSTLADALSGRRARPPRLDVLRRFVRACGLGDEGVAGWEAAWRVLGAAGSARGTSADGAAGAAPAAAPGGEPPVPQPGRGMAAPFMLPADLADFCGQEEQVAALAGLLGHRPGDAAGDAHSGPLVVVITGRGGVGKTALAVHAAHLSAGAYPDGQLYADLHGADGSPAVPGMVLGRLLLALGVAPGALPAGVEERAGLYRGILAGRRVLVVLDSAASAAQVRPLLPGSASCAVVMTSRCRLAELSVTRRLDISVFGSGEAVRLLARIAGPERVAAEPAAADEIARLCGHLPLAIRIAGARLAARPYWSLSRLARRLAGERGRLDELAVGDLDVRSGLSLSYRALTPAAARAFRLLALLDAPDFAAWIAAPLLDADLDRAVDLVEDLADARLLDAAGSGRDGEPRYRFHELVRLFGRERAQVEDTPVGRHAALARALSGWLTLAERADARLPATERPPIRGTAARWAAPGGWLRLCADPEAWFEAERANLVAAVSQACRAGLGEHAWELAGSIGNYLDLRGYHQETAHAFRCALAACRQAGNRLGEAVCLLGLALVPSDATAGACLAWTQQAAELFGRLGERRGQAKALELAAYLHCPAGRVDEVIRCIRTALPVAQAAGCRDVKAYLWYDRGLAHSVCGDYLEAEASFLEALRISQRYGLRLTEAAALHGLGAQDRRRGEYARAALYLEQALAAADKIGHASLQAIVLANLADSYAALGHPGGAATATRALECARSHGIAYAHALSLTALGRVRHGEGRPAEAAALCEEGRLIASGLRAPFQQALVLESIGKLHQAAGRPGKAASAWRDAQKLLARIGSVAETGQLDVLPSGITSH
jgi:tetratricopeptide (TPR) repeat protein